MMQISSPNCVRIALPASVVTKLIPALLLLIAAQSLFAQSEKPQSRVVVDSLQARYNSGRYDAIFANFSKGMQEALPLDKTRAFFGQIQQGAGSMKQCDFLRYESGSAKYKCTFDKGLYLLSMAANAELQIEGLFIKEYLAANHPVLERNTTSMRWPLEGEWYVVWGGDTEELNYHVVSEAQKGAFDLVMVDERGATHRGDGKENADYYAFGKRILAPCAAEVVLVVDGVKDNVPGVMNPTYVPGNTVILKTAQNEYLLFGHFQQHSIAVKQGQKVKPGQVLGLCGNSGNSSEAHLHFHIQNVEEMNVATGAKCYFENLLVNGERKTDYSPIKGERVSDAGK